MAVKRICLVTAIYNLWTVRVKIKNIEVRYTNLQHIIAYKVNLEELFSSYVTEEI